MHPVADVASVIENTAAHRRVDRQVPSSEPSEAPAAIVVDEDRSDGVVEGGFRGRRIAEDEEPDGEQDDGQSYHSADGEISVRLLM